MAKSDKFLHLLGIPHSAFLSVIFGMMLLSFPIGMFLVFHSDMGQEINFELPLGLLDGTGDHDLGFLLGVELGDAFLAVWSVYAVLFAIAMAGPREGFMKTMSSVLSRIDTQADSNYMATVTKWFSIFILVSVVVIFVQQGLGIDTIPPPAENDLIRFFYISLAPLVEEVGFRVILIGIPLFAFYSYKFSAKYFFKSLWNPSQNLHVHDRRKVLALIVSVGVLFGLAHVVVGEAWSEGKFVQAAAGGIILGWVYFRFGFVAAVLIHWATNYFIFAYANLLAQINGTTVDAAFSHSLFDTMGVLFLASGILSVVVLVGRHYFNSKRQLEI